MIESHGRRGSRSGALTRTVRFLFAALLATIGLSRSARAQELDCDPGDIEVRKLSFEGNRTFSDLVLSASVVTTPTSATRRFLWIPIFGQRRCLDRTEFPLDVVRLRLFYLQRGYYRATVDTIVKPMGKTAIGITFRIDEGEPVRIRTLTIGGLDSVQVRERIVRNLPLRVGVPFDKYDLVRAVDSIQTRLRNNGYPSAEVLRSFFTDTSALAADIELTVVPYARARIGRVDVDVTPREGTGSIRIPVSAARRLIAVRPGTLYSERELIDAKRRLYQTDAYTQVDIAADSVLPGDSVVNIRVALTENYMYAPRIGVGYGTVDCFRAQGELTDRHFLRGLARIELTGQVSKIGVARIAGLKSTDFSDDFPGADPCGTARLDTNSTRLNYYLGATLRTPALWRLRTVPTITLYRERRSEYRAYLRTTLIGGVASVTSERFPRTPITTAYEMRYGRTEAAPALFCAVFNRCDPNERRDLLELRRVGVLSWSVTRNRADDVSSPSRGSVVRLELRHASPLVLSDRDLEFNKVLGDAAWYWPVGKESVLAARLRVGGVFGRTLGTLSDFVPQEERLYAGGPNTVRGFRQNELGPVVYTARPDDTVRVVTDTAEYLEVQPSPDGGFQYQRAVPTGGNSVVVGNVEYRFLSPFLPELLQFTTFLDVGEVWNRGKNRLNLDFRSLKWTPGVGVRVFTPVGAIRLDVGYNSKALPPGPIYLETPLASGGALLCVSPGNGVAVTGSPPQQDPAKDCSGSFTPQARRRFLQRLAYQISIGQAF